MELIREQIRSPYDRVARCPLEPDPCTVEYTEASAPPNANDLGSESLDLYVLIHASNLVTTP